MIKHEERFEGVDPRLVAVAHRAAVLFPHDIQLIEGLRTEAMQREYVRLGKSKTMASYHLRGKAIDIAPLVHGTIDWKDATMWHTLEHCMKEAAKELGHNITWGGDWKTFVDMPHFQLED